MKTLLSVSLLFAFAALAQDAVTTVRQQDVTPTGGIITLYSDGGCALTAITAVVSPSPSGVRTAQTARAFNGARCTTVRNALQKCAELDVSDAIGTTVGDGGIP